MSVKNELDNKNSGCDCNDCAIKALNTKLQESNARLAVLESSAGELLKNYEKCSQNPHNDPTIAHRYLDKLREALTSNPSDAFTCFERGNYITQKS